jgi:hypothetical protein
MIEKMTRVVPSQAVATIEQLFPGSRDSASRATYSFGNAGALRGIVDLIRQIPQELLILPADQYADLVITLGAIEHHLLTWASRDAGRFNSIILQNVNGRDPLVLIRQALLECPDEYPPPSTADLQFIPDQALRDSIRRDVGAANQALHNGEWKAATVLAGAAIEALLHWKLSQAPLTTIDLTKASAAAVSKNTLKKAPPKDMDHWGLRDFIEIAGELKVIKPATVAAATLARDFRNLIHPGAAARRAEVCDRATALSALAGLEHVIRDLS